MKDNSYPGVRKQYVDAFRCVMRLELLTIEPREEPRVAITVTVERVFFKSIFYVSLQISSNSASRSEHLKIDSNFDVPRVADKARQLVRDWIQDLSASAPANESTGWYLI